MPARSVRDDACGAFALRGLVHWARRHELDERLLHLGTSADAGGDPGRVVGYAAFALLPSMGLSSRGERRLSTFDRSLVDRLAWWEYRP